MGSTLKITFRQCLLVGWGVVILDPQNPAPQPWPCQGHFRARRDGGAECIVGEPQLPGWRLGGLNSFTALGQLDEWERAPPWRWPRIDDIFIAN